MSKARGQGAFGRKSLAGDMLKGAVWALSGNAMTSILQLALTAFLARMLMPADFGLIAAAAVVMGFAQLFSQMGVGSAVVQRADLTPAHARTAHILAIASGLVFAALMAASAPLIAGFFRQPELVGVVRVMSVGFILKGFGVVPQSLLQRELRFRTLSLVELLGFLIGNAGCGIALAMEGFGYWSLVFSFLVNSLVISVAVCALRPLPLYYPLRMQAVREMLAQGGGFTSSYILNYFAVQGDNFVVGRALGAEVLGLYSRAYQLMAAPANSFAQPLYRVLFSGLSKIQAERERLRQIYLRGLSLGSTLMLPFCAIALVLAPEIVLILLGPAWSGAVEPFRILALGTYFRVVHKLGGSLSQAMGASYAVAGRQAIYALLVVGGSWIAKPWGITGIAWAVQGAMLAHFIFTSHLVSSLIGVQWGPFAAAQLRGMALGAAVGLTAWGVAQFLRSADASPVAVAAGTAAFAGALSAGVGALFPRFILGEAGRWFVGNVSKALWERKKPSVAENMAQAGVN